MFADDTLETLLTKYAFIGDVHGDFAFVQKMSARFHDKVVVQIGDLGIGFTKTPDPRFNVNMKFIRGNHDNPLLARANPHHLGDFGYTGSFYYVAGANSIDRYLRKEGVDWWPDEEISYLDGCEVQAEYDQIKPKVMVTHDCPQSFMEMMFGYNQRSTTRVLFDVLLMDHKPEIWIFGHHHKSIDYVWNETRYICLNINEVLARKAKDDTQH